MRKVKRNTRKNAQSRIISQKKEKPQTAPITKTNGLSIPKKQFVAWATSAATLLAVLAALVSIYQPMAGSSIDKIRLQFVNLLTKSLHVSSIATSDNNKPRLDKLGRSYLVDKSRQSTSIKNLTTKPIPKNNVAQYLGGAVDPLTAALVAGQKYYRHRKALKEFERAYEW